ncbi:lysozyme inhibitor LprI family protein [Aestuariibius sp. 2305UL40-4]|uniref:lysozyme inhibitor LprI family protein n=1 Tax=Aestuariibius violaceus TaxID=3234132 RepID=UPI00345ECA88
MRRGFIFLFSALAAPLAAQEIDFDIAPVEACLLEAPDKRSCVGLAAETCAETPDGGTTVGLGFCYGRELDWWDARLNVAYQDLLAQKRELDAEMEEIGATVPSQADALQAMQRAWIAYRDATCDYERSLWGGGTGGGPATSACLMRETGEQALYLEAGLEQR